jgi:hypothetical protein
MYVRRSGLQYLFVWPCTVIPIAKFRNSEAYPEKLALTSTTIGGFLVGIIHSWTQTTEFVYFLGILWLDLTCVPSFKFV